MPAKRQQRKQPNPLDSNWGKELSFSDCVQIIHLFHQEKNRRKSSLFKVFIFFTEQNSKQISPFLIVFGVFISLPVTETESSGSVSVNDRSSPSPCTGTRLAWCILYSCICISVWYCLELHVGQLTITISTTMLWRSCYFFILFIDLWVFVRVEVCQCIKMQLARVDRYPGKPQWGEARRGFAGTQLNYLLAPNKANLQVFNVLQYVLFSNSYAFVRLPPRRKRTTVAWKIQ